RLGRSCREAGRGARLKDDDEALQYLERRGIHSGVIEVLRALLAALPVVKTPSIQKGRYGDLVQEVGRRKAQVITERCQLAMLDIFGKIPTSSEIQDDPLTQRIGEWLNDPARPWHKPGSSHAIPNKTTVRRAAGRGAGSIGLIVPNPPK
ncbi:MAG: hypothetical protein QHC89_28615, partial [Bosea sp. (in: a-proteobacteria)]|nr:hypothetical protein [Bosea sp. (in: a-proteobacteria)]